MLNRKLDAARRPGRARGADRIVNQIEQDTEHVLRIGDHVDRRAAYETERCRGRNDRSNEAEHFLDCAG